MSRRKFGKRIFTYNVGENYELYFEKFCFALESLFLFAISTVVTFYPSFVVFGSCFISKGKNDLEFLFDCRQ